MHKIIGVPEQHIQRIYLNDIHIEQARKESLFEHIDDIIFNDISIGAKTLNIQVKKKQTL